MPRKTAPATPMRQARKSHGITMSHCTQSGRRTDLKPHHKQKRDRHLPVSSVFRFLMIGLLHIPTAVMVHHDKPVVKTDQLPSRELIFSNSFFAAASGSDHDTPRHDRMTDSMVSFSVPSLIETEQNRPSSIQTARDTSSPFPESVIFTPSMSDSVTVSYSL